MTDAVRILEDTAASRAPDAFLVDARSGRELAYGQLWESAATIAADLAERGLRRGDRIAIVAQNSTRLAQLYFGCLAGGLVTVPVNPVLAVGEVEFIVRSSGVRTLVSTPRTMSALSPGTIESVDTQLVMDEGLGDDAGSWWPPGAGVRDYPMFDGVVGSDTMTIVYTSGTTSRPTGVVHSIENLVGNGLAFRDTVELGPGNRFYGVLSMAYLGGYFNLLMIPFLSGGSIVISDAFDARSALRFWQPAMETGVNSLWLVPTMMAILMELDRGDAGAEFCKNAVKLALCGTAPLPVQLRKRFEARYGVSVLESYGLSETLLVTTNVPGREVVDGSVGAPLPGVGVRIEEGASAPKAGPEGEILVRTPHLMQGYHDPESMSLRPVDRAEWFPTGDAGTVDAAGEVFVTGRLKDLIIRGGINVSPASIEQATYEHPAVLECAVVAVPHAHYGEDVAAVVRLEQGVDLDAVRPELDVLWAERLAQFQRPAHVLQLSEFPRSTTGKIRKAELRSLVTYKLGLDDLIPAEE